MTPLAHNQFNQAFSAGRLHDAKKVVLIALEQSADDWNAIYLLGVICRAQGDFHGALSRYHEALRLSSQSAPILRACGIAHQQLGEFDQAVSAFAESLREEPESVEALNSLGITYRKMGKHHHALYYYCIAVNLCIESAYTALQKDGLVRTAVDSVVAKGTLIAQAGFERFSRAVLNTPYITIIENIGAAFDALGNSERASYFFHIADTKSPVDEDLLLQIYKKAEQDAGLNPPSAGATGG